MISFYYELPFALQEEALSAHWLSQLIEAENKKLGEVTYVFCTDEYLLEHNIKYLKHNTLTDIISFDYSMGNLISGDIFISVDRVKENAATYEVSMDEELHRVMAHGVLHYCGYKDKTKEEKLLMREKEDYYLSLRTF